MVYLDTPAVFTCQLNDTAFGGWFVNGTDTRELPELRDDISTRDEGLTMVLNITARTQYNNTVVQCLALMFGGNGTERSDNVTLTIQGILLHLQLHI